jgi:hypothetical protein
MSVLSVKLFRLHDLPGGVYGIFRVLGTELTVPWGRLIIPLRRIVNFSFFFLYKHCSGCPALLACLIKRCGNPFLAIYVAISMVVAAMNLYSSKPIFENLKVWRSTPRSPIIGQCLILDRSHLVGNLTNSKIAETKALEPLKS